MKFILENKKNIYFQNKFFNICSIALCFFFLSFYLIDQCVCLLLLLYG